MLNPLSPLSISLSLSLPPPLPYLCPYRAYRAAGARPGWMNGWMVSRLFSWRRLVSPDTRRTDGGGQKRGERWMDGCGGAIQPSHHPSMPAQGAGMASSTNDSASWTTTPSTHQLCVMYLYPYLYLYLCPRSRRVPCRFDASSSRFGVLSLYSHPLHQRRLRGPAPLLSGRPVVGGGIQSAPEDLNRRR